MIINNLEVLDKNVVGILSKQWVEYSDIYMKPLPPSLKYVVLQDLNQSLSVHSFLGGSTVTDADIKIFNLLKDVMAQLNFQDKEKLNHLSRWYNVLQNTTNNTAPVLFSRTTLY